MVVAEFNANEPTRDLYAGARIGLDIVAGRYLRLAVLTDILEKNTGASSSRKTVAHIEDATPWKALKPVEDWASGEDKTAMLRTTASSGRRAITPPCMDLGLQGLCDAAVAWKTSYSSAYARDLLRLDDEIREQGSGPALFADRDPVGHGRGAVHGGGDDLALGRERQQGGGPPQDAACCSPALNVPWSRSTCRRRPRRCRTTHRQSATPPWRVPPPPWRHEMRRAQAQRQGRGGRRLLVQPRKPTAQEVQVVMLNTLQAAADELNTRAGRPEQSPR